MKSLRKNNTLIISLLLIVLLMSVGFAVISTTLNINGTATVKKQTWDIHFSNINITDGSVTALKDAVISNEAATLVEYKLVLEKPGDFYEFTVDAVNEGTLDAKIELVSLNGLEGHEEYVNYQVSYLDGTEIKIGDALNSETSETYKVRVEYKDNMATLPSVDQNITLTFATTYSQGHDGEVITDYYTLTGIVYGEDGQPMTSGEVEVHSRIIKTPIGSDGTYILKNVPVGNHEIKVLSDAGEILKEDTFSLSSGESTTVVNNQIVISENNTVEFNIILDDGVKITTALPKHTVNIISENGETKEVKVTKGENENISILPNEGYEYLNMTCDTLEDIKYNQETQEVEINNLNENTTCNIVFEKMEGYDEGPVVTLSQNGNSEYQQSVSTTINLETKIGSMVSETQKYIISTDKEAEATETLVNGQEITIDEETGIYYIIVEACNSIGVCSRFVSEPYYIDTTAPTITFSTNGNSTYAKSHSTIVNAIDDDSDIDSIKYIVSIYNTTAPTKTLENGGTVTISNMSGDYYVVVEACDKAGNCKTQATTNTFALDNKGPTITYGTNGNTTYAKSHKTTVTASDTYSEIETLTYITGTSNTLTPTITIANGGTITINSGTGDYYAVVKACDTLGNCTTKASNVFKMDNTAPTIVYGTNGNTTYAKSHSTTVTASDSHSQLNTLKYITGTSNTATPSTDIASGETVTISSGTGNYYVVSEACDKAGNCATLASNVFKMDNTAPTIVYGTNGNTTYAQSHSTTVTASDSHSQLNTLKYIKSTSNTATPSTSLTNGGTVTLSGVTGDYYVVSQACDKAGNCKKLASNVFKLDNEAPTISVTVSLDTASIVMKDNVELDVYTIETPTLTTAGKMIETSYTTSYTGSEPGTYTITATDTSGNSASKTFTLEESAFCTSDVGKTWNYTYTGDTKTFFVTCPGTYKLEVWGAQGGNIDDTNKGGYGGYSVGNVSVEKYDKLYITVGGQGSVTGNTANEYAAGGYNGGGMGHNSFNEGRYASGGGGATHIAKTTNRGELYNYEDYLSEVLIVAGGGSGTWYFNGVTWKNTALGHGGGYKGVTGSGYVNGETVYADGGTQSAAGTEGNSFGTFGQSVQTAGEGSEVAGGGGGLYGGNRNHYSAGGGSGYIGNSSLTSKSMYCYNCPTSTATSTKTISTTNVNVTPTSGYAKIGNGYARLTLMALSN